MVVEAVVFDVSDTLVDLRTDEPAPGIVEAVESLRGQGIIVVAIGNHPSVDLERALQRAGIGTDLVVGWDITGKPKGSPEWGKAICRLTDLRPNQLMIVGDDRLDMVTATWDGIVYVHAAWVKPSTGYGLVAPSPAWIAAIVQHIFRKTSPWYWSLDKRDGAERLVKARTLLEAGSDFTANPLPVAMRGPILNLLKGEVDSSVGQMSLQEFVMLHMLASVYESGLFSETDFWTTYPGHDGKPNTVMGDFLGVASKLFRKRYVVDLFERHTEAQRSRDAWSQGGALGARKNQLDTMRIGKKYQGKLAGKRVLVLDNFLTRGYSTEAARSLLLASGCAEIVVACVGKYGRWMHMIAPPPSTSWDPFSKNPPDPVAFSDVEGAGDYDRGAMTEFCASYDAIAAATW